MASSKRTNPDRVIIFSRYPDPGKTKTRLIPQLGPVGAADLHRGLTVKTFNTARKIFREHDIGIEICFEGGSRQKIRRWLGPLPIISRQSSGDLGRRMFHAFGKAFQDWCRRVVLIGTDIPGLTEKHLLEAFEALNYYDVIFGPSTDGGYWMIGLKRPVDLFKGIGWGTKNVLNDTISVSKRMDLKAYLLEALADMDTIEDLWTWQPDKSWNSPYLSVVIPTLNEEVNIGRTILSALDQSAEIIVVDGGSNDGTVTRAMNSKARVLTSPPGRAFQQNHGARISRGKMLLFLHADTLLPKGYINLIFDTFMDSQVIAGAFRFRTDLKHPFMKMSEEIVNIRSRFFQLPYGDQGFFLRKSVFESIGGFPEMPVAEDLFFIRHLRKMGRIRIAPAWAITSARRWRTLGLVRTTLINYRILAGCLLGISPHRLATLYKIPPRKLH